MGQELMSYGAGAELLSNVVTKGRRVALAVRPRRRGDRM